LFKVKKIDSVDLIKLMDWSFFHALTSNYYIIEFSFHFN